MNAMNLFEATQENNLSRVKECLATERITVMDSHGSGLLHHAVLCDAMEVFMFLIENGIPLNTQNKYQESPLMIAAHMAKLTMMKWLIKYGANVNLPDALGNTALHRACKKGNLDAIRLLLERGAHPHAQNAKGESPLHMAIMSQDLHVIALMMEQAKVSVHHVDLRQNGLLHHAVKTNKCDIVAYLIKKGICIHQKNLYKETALFEACRYAHTEVLQLLIEAGATLNVRNTFGETPFDACLSQGRRENLAYLETVLHSSTYKNYCEHYPLHLAVIEENTEEIARLAVYNGFDKVDPFGFTPNAIAKKLYPCPKKD